MFGAERIKDVDLPHCSYVESLLFCCRAQEEAELRGFAARPNMIELIQKRVAPQIFGAERIKEIDSPHSLVILLNAQLQLCRVAAVLLQGSGRGGIQGVRSAPERDQAHPEAHRAADVWRRAHQGD